MIVNPIPELPYVFVELSQAAVVSDGTLDSEGWRTSALITQVGNQFWRILNVDSVARSGDVTVLADVCTMEHDRLIDQL